MLKLDGIMGLETDYIWWHAMLLQIGLGSAPRFRPAQPVPPLWPTRGEHRPSPSGSGSTVCKRGLSHVSTVINYDRPERDFDSCGIYL